VSVNTALAVLFFVCFAVTPCAACAWLWFAARAIAFLKPGATVHDPTGLRPFNHLFYADRFTEEGLRYRKKAAWAIVLMIAPSVVLTIAVFVAWILGGIEFEVQPPPV
jgi:hypothetical protein